jgi:hypothetical protein
MNSEIAVLCDKYKVNTSSFLRSSGYKYVASPAVYITCRTLLPLEYHCYMFLDVPLQMRRDSERSQEEWTNRLDLP